MLFIIITSFSPPFQGVGSGFFETPPLLWWLFFLSFFRAHCSSPRYSIFFPSIFGLFNTPFLLCIHYPSSPKDATRAISSLHFFVQDLEFLTSHNVVISNSTSFSKTYRHKLNAITVVIICSILNCYNFL